MSDGKKRSIFWFRRDLRLTDNPALLAALAESDEVLCLFVMDEAVAGRAGEYRRAYLADSLKALNETLNGHLAVVSAAPEKILPALIAEYGISTVHCAHDFTPYGMARDAKVEEAGIELIKTGSGYAVSPGRVHKPDGGNYRVYTPFSRAWLTHGWRAPVAAPKNPRWIAPKPEHQQLPNWPAPEGITLQKAGEKAALNTWQKYRDSHLAAYDQERNFPGIPGTSRLSPHLRWGEIHPRTILADLGSSTAHEIFRKEIAWREFYADVLFHYPHTSRDYYSPEFARMRYEKPGKQFQLWCEGKTGYPVVDAGMRQLVAEGWMHNRVRMIVASFLVKDLHIEWKHGAAHFMKYLIDNDVASNSHGWQWTAGCGTDASPYYRIFNPVEQGKRFDPEGDYVRRYVPELAHLSGAEVHEPWNYLDGYLHNYPAQIVDHAAERLDSLARLAELKEATSGEK